jgi:hypothetical protein
MTTTPEQPALTTEWVSTDDLRPHPSNPKNGDIDAIAESLRVNQQYRPIVIAQDGTILAGNHTYMATMSLGRDRIAAVRLPISPDSPEALRIMLADNRTADLGNYDDGVLAELLATLDGMESGLLGTGYDQDDLAKMLASLDEPLDLDGHPYGNVYMLIVTCRNEKEQTDLITELNDRGINVRAGLA